MTSYRREYEYTPRMDRYPSTIVNRGYVNLFKWFQLYNKGEQIRLNIEPNFNARRIALIWRWYLEPQSVNYLWGKAADYGYLDIVRDLYVEFDPDEFESVIFEGWPDIFQFFSNQPDAVFDISFIPIAAQQPVTRILQQLLDRIDPTSEDLNQLFFDRMFRNGYLPNVRLLLNYGLDPKPWLNVAIQWGHYRIVKLLLDYGADPHQNDDESIKIAIRHNYPQIVQLLNDRMAINEG